MVKIYLWFANPMLTSVERDPFVNKEKKIIFRSIN